MGFQIYKGSFFPSVEEATGHRCRKKIGSRKGYVPLQNRAHLCVFGDEVLGISVWDIFCGVWQKTGWVDLMPAAGTLHLRRKITRISPKTETRTIIFLNYWLKKNSRSRFPEHLDF